MAYSCCPTWSSTSCGSAGRRRRRHWHIPAVRSGRRPRVASPGGGGRVAMKPPGAFLPLARGIGLAVIFSFPRVAMRPGLGGLALALAKSPEGGRRVPKSSSRHQPRQGPGVLPGCGTGPTAGRRPRTVPSGLPPWECAVRAALAAAAPAPPNRICSCKHSVALPRRPTAPPRAGTF